MKPTKEEKRKRDEAIALVWEHKKAEWIMKDLSPMFNLHIDTIYTILKEAREKENFNKFKLNRDI